MSLEGAKNFTARMIGDRRLASELAAATADKSAEEKAIAAAEMATRLGYGCSAEEAREVRDAVVRLVSHSALGEGELTDQQLEAVAGGISVSGFVVGYLKGSGSLTGGSTTAIGVALGGSIGPAALATAAVGGALNTIDNSPQAAQSGVTSQSIGNKIGDAIGGFFSDAFSGW